MEAYLGRGAAMATTGRKNAPMPKPMLELDNVHTYYDHIHALKGISMTVNEGEIVALIGGNGAGKTTTLRTISGMMKPRTGSMTFEGRPSPGFPRTTSCRRASATCPRAAGSSRT